MNWRNIMTLWGIFLFVAAVCIFWLCGGARAEDELTEYWVLCQPDSYVTIRAKPNKHSSAEGMAYAGDKFFSDGRKEGQWVHMVHVSNELGEGWISDKYLTRMEPEMYEQPKVCTVNVKELNCRMCIGGSRRGVLKRGAEVKVYLMSDDWAVTNKGYIQSKYLD